MAQTTIYKEESTKNQRFFCDNILIGTAKYTSGFARNEIVIYQHDKPILRFTETNRMIWFIKKCLPCIIYVLTFLLNWTPFFFFISLALILLLKRQYTVFEDNKKVGYTKNKWVKAMRDFILYDDHYCVSIHKNEQFSLLKNGKQIALYSKEPVKILNSRSSTYHVSYAGSERIEIIELFCLIIDLFLFTDYDGTTTLKIIVPRDPHPEYTQWKPEEK